MRRPARRSALVMWASRMLGRGPDRRYADIMERALYNGALSGLSHRRQRVSSTTIRSKAAATITAGTGIAARAARRISPARSPSIGSYMYGVSADEIAVHLYGESTARLTVGSTPRTPDPGDRLPMDGRVAITVGLDAPATFALSLRVPGWCGAATAVRQRRKRWPRCEHGGGYFHLEREWKDGDGSTSTCRCPCARSAPTRRSRPISAGSRWRAVRSIYCAEEVDNGADLNAMIVADRRWRRQGRADARTRRRRWRSMCRSYARPGRTGGRLYDLEPPGCANEATLRCPITSGTTGMPARCWSGSGRGDEREHRRHRRKPPIELRGVRKSFGSVDVIHGLDLKVEGGEFVVFVGPSGCGKSTLLRMIAGLEDVTDGDILIAGRDVTDLDPAKRGIAMVFQSYALYPHMTVRENLAFGLEIARTPAAEIERQVSAAAEILKIGPAAAIGGPASSRAASDSASRSAGRSCASRSSSCSTSRSPISTRSCASACASRSRACIASSATR